MLNNCYVFFSFVKRKSKSLILLSLLTVFNNSIGWAEDYTSLPSVRISPSIKNETADRYPIGSRILVSLPLPAGEASNLQTKYSIQVPEGSSPLQDQGWIIDPSFSVISGNLQLIVIPVQSGTLTLPLLILYKTDSQSQQPFLRTEPWSITVTAPEVDAKKEPEFLPPTSVSLATQVWIFLILGIGLMIALTVYALRKYIQSRPAPAPLQKPVVAPDPEHVIAFKKLDALFSANTDQDLKASFKPIAFGVSDILKEFFSARFKIDAKESTTSELFQILSDAGLTSSNKKDIQLLFHDLDLVKFTQIENYRHFDANTYKSIRNQAEAIISKWGGRKP
jgi:hypothetical protein